MTTANTAADSTAWILEATSHTTDGPKHAVLLITSYGLSLPSMTRARNSTPCLQILYTSHPFLLTKESLFGVQKTRIFQRIPVPLD